MSRDWTWAELQAASKAMKEMGYMSYEELCEKMKRQDELKRQEAENMSREQFYHALDDFFCKHPETEGMEIISVRYDKDWNAVGELDGVAYLLAMDIDGISMDKIEE